MNITVLRNFNNYVNRVVKGFKTLAEYISKYESLTFNNINFIPGDDITTTQVLNISDGWTPDYLITTDDNGEIVSRWFVLDCSRNRSSQYYLQLKRDVIYDKLEKIINSPCYVQKGFVNKNNPLIYNKEGMVLNQIKTNEYQLNDNTRTAWIVGYMGKGGSDDPTSGKQFTGDINTTSADIVVDDISTWSFYKYVNQDYNVKNNIDYIAYVKKTNTLSNFTFNKVSTDGALTTVYGAGNQAIGRENVNYSNQSVYEILWDARQATSTIYLRSKDININNGLYQFKDQIIKDTSTNTYYKIKLETKDTVTKTVDIVSNDGYVLTDLISRFESYNGIILENSYNGGFKATYSYTPYRIVLSPVQALTASIKGTWKTNPTTAADGPYTIFCIPYPEYDSNTVFTVTDGESVNYITQDIAFQVAQAISKTFTGAGQLYDIQLLPYCPFASDKTFGFSASFTSKGGKFYLDHNITNVDNIYKIWVTNDKDVNICPIIICKTGTFKNTIGKTISNMNSIYFDSLTSEQVKLINETKKFRLVSNNFANFEDLYPMMNQGIDTFDVECTYKPYNPYIHISPNYKGLYGKDFDDVRGLICGGDFSLPQTNNAWETYQINNKNYASIFDREQTHLERTQKLQMEQAKWGVGLNAAGAALSGAAAGAISFGPAGAAAGVATGALSGIAGGKDIQILTKSQKEQMSYQQDMYNYRLGNIQAMPQGLAKNTGVNFNTRLFPMLEVYEATEQENNMFLNKLKYNGMTVGAIGTLSEYNSADELTYVQGQLLRLEDIGEDYHTAMSIYEEVAKGLYI